MKKLFTALLSTVLLGTAFIGLSFSLFPQNGNALQVAKVAKGSGCTAKVVKGKGNWTVVNWHWVELSCGNIQNAKQARATIYCDYAPDKSTSWLVSGESGESGGCPFGYSGTRIEYR